MGIAIVDIGKKYGQWEALKGISIEAPAGSYVVLLGPSGSGKTTLLNIVAGFDEADHGRILIGGEDMAGRPPAARPTATVFQDYALFPHMSVLDNVAFGLRMGGQARGARHAAAADALALVGLAGFGARRIHELSGGQRQRVALARAMVVRPKVLLLDEPLGALDLNLRRQMQRELRQLQQQSGTTFLHITHDQEEAMSLADLLVVMNAGRVEDAGPPARVFHRPRSAFTATFVGENNLIPASRDGSGRLVTALGHLPLPAGEEDAIACVAIRPAHIEIGPAAPGSLSLGTARIMEVMYMGTFFSAKLRPARAPDLLLGVHADGRVAPVVGQEVELSTSLDAISIIPAGVEA